MMSRSTQQRLSIWLVAVVAGLGLACDDECGEPVGPGGGGGTGGEPTEAACVGCHTDEAKLQATATPDTSSGGEEPSGEG